MENFGRILNFDRGKGTPEAVLRSACADGDKKGLDVGYNHAA